MNHRTELTPHEIDDIVVAARKRGGRRLAVRRVGSTVAAMALVAGLGVGTFTLVDRNNDAVAPGDQPPSVTQSEGPPPLGEEQAQRKAEEEARRVAEKVAAERKVVEEHVRNARTTEEKNALVSEIALNLLPEGAKYRSGPGQDLGEAAPYQPPSASWIMEDDLGALAVSVQLREVNPGGGCVAPVCTEVDVDGGVVMVLDGAADGKSGQQMAWQLVRDDGYEIVLTLSNRTVMEYTDGSKSEEFTREGPLPMDTDDAVAFLTDPAWEPAVAAEAASPTLK